LLLQCRPIGVKWRRGGTMTEVMMQDRAPKRDRVHRVADDIVTANSLATHLAWISTDKNLTNAGSAQGIHLTREFGVDCYPK
jgi:hypothetical protein